MRSAALASLLLLTAAASPGGERRYMITGFERIRVNGPFAVEVVPGATSASAQGEAEALDRLSIRVDGGTLIVNSGASGWERRTRDAPNATRIRVSTPLLRGLAANGGAQVRVAEMRAPRVDIALEGVGSIDIASLRAEELHVGHNGMGVLKLAGTAGQVRLRGAAGATVDAAALLANDATLLWESPGALTIRVRYTAQVSAHGKGPVTLLGKPFCKISGTAPITCGDGSPRP